MKTFWGQIIARLGSETPVFFKKILIFGISLGGIGTAILGIDAAHLPVPIPEFIQQAAGYLVTAGIFCAAVAKTATTDPTLQAQGGSNVVVNQKQDPPASTPRAVAPPIPDKK